MEHTNHQFTLVSGHVNVPNSNKVIAVTIVYQTPQKNIRVQALNTENIEYLTSIEYSEPIPMDQYHKERDAVRQKAIDVIIYFLNSNKNKNAFLKFNTH